MRDITLEGVSFVYEGRDDEALTGVDLTIRRGEQIGICGPTGGGKTTLVDLVTGLLTPSAGRVIVDGTRYRRHTSEGGSATWGWSRRWSS